MTIPIRPYVTPQIPFIAWQAFTPEECDKIKKLGELCAFDKARIGNKDKGKEDTEYRDTDIAWIEPNEKNFWMFEKLDQLISYLNYTHFQLDIDRFDGFQYSKYKEGGHYKFHSDVVVDPHHGMFRKLSVVVMLSDEEDYEGGVFSFLPGGNIDKPERVKLKKGQMILFLSHIVHQVEPVTKGKRLTLVTWVLGDKPR